MIDDQLFLLLGMSVLTAFIALGKIASLQQLARPGDKRIFCRVASCRKIGASLFPSAMWSLMARMRLSYEYMNHS